MMTVDLDQADPPLAPLLAAVEGRGETVLLCRAGRAVAELRAAPITLFEPESGLPYVDPFAEFTASPQEMAELATRPEQSSESFDGPPTQRGINRLKQHPQLKVTFLYDPMEPASEDEWPSEFR